MTEAIWESLSADERDDVREYGRRPVRHRWTPGDDAAVDAWMRRFDAMDAENKAKFDAQRAEDDALRASWPARKKAMLDAYEQREAAK